MDIVVHLCYRELQPSGGRRCLSVCVRVCVWSGGKDLLGLCNHFSKWRAGGMKWNAGMKL